MLTERSIASALKQLHPVWRIGVIEATFGTPDEGILDLQLEVKRKCMHEAAELIQTLDIQGAESDWAQSYFASHIARLICDDWPDQREATLNRNYAKHLAAIATEPMYAGLPKSWHNSAAEVSYVATALNALSGAMQAYSDFNLFHFDRDKIQLFFQEAIITHAQEAAVSVAGVIENGTASDSLSSLYQVFLKNAGVEMQDIWRAQSRIFLDRYRTATTEEQLELRRMGGDLETILMLHKSGLLKLAAMSRQALSVADGLSSNSSPSMNQD